MKKFLSMVMAAAMVVSLVPATAFAASGDIKATAKVVDAKNFAVDEIKPDGKIGGSELQMTLTTADTVKTGADVEFTLTLDNAKFGTESPSIYVKDGTDMYTLDSVDGYDKNLKDETLREFSGVTSLKGAVVLEDADDKDEIKVRFTGEITRGMVFCVNLASTTMDKVSKGKTATVSVDSDDMTVVNGDDLVYASVESKGIKASVKDTVDVATEEVATLKDIKIEPSVGDTMGAVLRKNDKGVSEIKLKLNSGFEFDKNSTLTYEGTKNDIGPKVTWDDDEVIFEVGDKVFDSEYLKIKGLKVEATSAKAGSTATIKVYADGNDTVSVEVAKVVDYTVVMSVDKDEDVPVIYSGVDVDNTGITDDSDHESLEVTIKESFAGAWNNSKDFTLSLPEGVYVADEISTSTDGDFKLTTSDKTTEQWFQDAYDEGDYIDLTFKRRTWEETNPNDTNKDDPAEISFTLKLVADPNFEGDVVLKLTGDAVEEQEVTVAKFVKPFVVEAQQNDMQIDYRNTEIPTSVVIKEAEAGLWDKGTTFEMSLDKIEFDDEGKIAVDDKSGLEIKDDEIKEKDGVLSFTIDSRSDDEPAVVTISGMQLYMQRSLPAGAYDLDVYSSKMLGAKATDKDNAVKGYLSQSILKPEAEKENTVIADINDDFYSTTAKAGFVNIITAGREDTDSFTTKVVVPVGEKYVISGETKQEIPVPAYINADGYTMLPLRAVSVALGINSNNVLWDQASRTATVMYGSKIISMTYGQKVVYVNAAPIPASTSVEIKENRMFLGLRDLGNALGVTDITWDAATKTATLNGNK